MAKSPNPDIFCPPKKEHVKAREVFLKGQLIKKRYGKAPSIKCSTWWAKEAS